MIEKEFYLKKKYDPKLEEKKILAIWEKEKPFSFNPESKKPIFSIDTPPPYTNASWHMGGAIHYAMIDMIARTMRMKGFETLFPMGLDRNGLPIEIQTEKLFNIDINNTNRQEFLNKCKTLLDKYSGQIIDLIKSIGFSCNSYDWDDIYKTDEPKYRALTQTTFLELWHKGLIYEDDKPTNWDIKLQTSISDSEIIYKEQLHNLYDIEFSIEHLCNEKIFISTTRPELIPAIKAIIFNPDDKRYQHLKNKRAITPIWEQKIPILAHSLAKPNFGSGLMMICSFGDKSDIQIFQEFKLRPNYIFDRFGITNENIKKQKYMNIPIEKAKNIIIDDLKSLNVIKETIKIKFNQPMSERSNSKIEFIGMPEFYLKQIEYTEILKSYIDKTKFHPPESRQIWIDWLNSITIDWPISRRRYYGTEIPLWYCSACNYIIAPKPGPYYQPWLKNPPLKKCPKCNGTSFEGETRIFDTWMDSSISAYYIHKYPLNRNITENYDFTKLNRKYIADLRPQGKEIVRTWLHYSMLRGHLLFNKPMFDHIWISGHIMDNKGEKMSKSKGNNIKPEDIIKKYGADALRLFGASEASLGSDLRFNEEKLKGISKLLNKLFNIAKFIAKLERPTETEFDINNLTCTDKWIINYLHNTLKEVLNGYSKFDFSIPSNLLRNFTKEIFSNHYMEMIKHRFYADQENKLERKSVLEQISSKYTMHYCFDMILQYFSPIIPFITDYIYRELYDKSINSLNWNLEFGHFNDIPKDLNSLLLNFNSDIWNAKRDLSLSLRQPIIIDELPLQLDIFQSDLISMHKLSINKELDRTASMKTKILNIAVTK